MSIFSRAQSVQCLSFAPTFFLSVATTLVTTNRRANRDRDRHTLTSIGGHSFLGCSHCSNSSSSNRRHSIRTTGNRQCKSTVVVVVVEGEGSKVHRNQQSYHHCHCCDLMSRRRPFTGRLLFTAEGFLLPSMLPLPLLNAVSGRARERLGQWQFSTATSSPAIDSYLQSLYFFVICLTLGPLCGSSISGCSRRTLCLPRGTCCTSGNLLWSSCCCCCCCCFPLAHFHRLLFSVGADCRANPDRSLSPSVCCSLNEK